MDIVVANAPGPPRARALEADDELLRAAVEANLLTSVRLVRAAVPSMRAAGWGRIVLLTSNTIKQPIPDLAASTAARAGLWGWAKSAAIDLIDDGITLNVLAPGLHDTDRVRELGHSGTAGRPRRLRPGRRVPVLHARGLRLRHGASGRRGRYAGAPVSDDDRGQPEGRGGTVQPDQQFDELADRAWDGLLEREPLIGTFIGDDRYDDRLEDNSDAGRAAEEDACRADLAALAEIDRDALDDGRALTADILQAICDRSLARIEHRLDLLDVANHMNGAASLLGQIATLQRADTPERVDKLAARLRAYPTYLANAEGQLRESAETKIVAPKVVVERTVGLVDRLLGARPRGLARGRRARGRDARHDRRRRRRQRGSPH